MTTCLNSPLAIEIALHYHVAPNSPFRDGDTSPAARKIKDYYIERGILIEHEDGGIVPDREALRVYVEALLAVPLPIKKWVVEATDA